MTRGDREKDVVPRKAVSESTWKAISRKLALS